MEHTLSTLPHWIVVAYSPQQEFVREISAQVSARAPQVEIHAVRTFEKLPEYAHKLRPDVVLVDVREQALAIPTTEIACPVITVGRAKDSSAQHVRIPADASPDQVVDSLLNTYTAHQHTPRVEETERHYHDILEASSDGIFVLLGGRFRYANNAFARAVGRRQEALRGVLLEDLVDPQQKQVVHEELARINVGDAGREVFEISVPAHDSTVCFEVSCRASVIDGKRCVVGIARDVTALRELQSEIERARVDMSRKDRLHALGELAAGVAHDFNNVLEAIGGRTARAIQRMRDGEDIQQDLEIIAQLSDDARHSVARIRDFAKRDADKWANIDLNMLANEAVAYVETTIPEHVEVSCEAQEVPSVQGQPAEFREVLLNLLRNAIDAVGESGKVRVISELYGGQPCLAVADSGPGIPQAVQERIFEPFFSTKGDRGTGLGLSVSRSILKRFGADIQVDSTPGEGTVFRIVFPQGPQERKVDAPPRKDVLSVVIVDDDQSVRELVVDILEDRGHRVVALESAPEAIRYLGEHRADVLLTDLDLPRMSGWQLARKVHEIQPKLYVGLMTGWPLGSSQAELHARGVDFVLSKPFSTTAFAAALGLESGSQDNAA